MGRRRLRIVVALRVKGVGNDEASSGILVLRCLLRHVAEHQVETLKDGTMGMNRKLCSNI